MITTAHRMESLSRSYLQAVAAQAGLNYSIYNHDYGIDVTLREVEQVGGRYWDTGRQLDVQLKSTTVAIEAGPEIKYDLDVRTYEHLRAEASFLRLLVLFVMPESEAEWVAQSADQLSLRRCAYWLNLRGAPPGAATATTRISIPRENVLTAPSLKDLIRRPIPRRA